MSNGKINPNNNISSSPEIDYQQLALDIFNEQNRVRTKPESYIEKLERATKFFKDKIFRHPAEFFVIQLNYPSKPTKASKAFTTR